jgi:hypothetical protein
MRCHVRRIILTLLTLVVSGEAVWSRDTLIAQAQTPLNFAIIINRYYDGLYTSAPVDSVRHVYFVGEPIDVVVDFGNAGNEEQSIDTRSVSIDAAFDIAPRQGSPKGVADLDLSPSGEIVVGDNQLIVNWGDVVTLGPRSRVVWEGQFRGPSAPGIYNWSVELKGVKSSRPINPLGTVLEYELRVPKDLGDRAEVARRRMLRAFDDENDVQFEAEARALLSIYPDSSLAFELRGRVAERSGRLSEAQTAYETALAFLRDGKDRLFLEHNSERRAAGSLADLRDATQRVRGGR